MAKSKSKNVVLDAQGQAVTSEVPDIIAAINESDIAAQTVARMQNLLGTLGARSEQYNVNSEQLFAKLIELGIDLETTVELYAALKQAFLTVGYIAAGDNTNDVLVTNMFSLIIGNAVFFRQFDYIPADKLVDVIIIVTNLMFQLEAGTNDDSGATA